ncbi:DUF6624 domain-containing protein [Streptomyces sp. YH02]|uniref:DUF6624 domain-containing protein n=1 Tax=Streptomyces sp. YH02 TaxID=3256999 RepID=UPI00375644B8
MDTREMMAVDTGNTAFLKTVIAAHGWPGYRLVGEEASSAAWLIAQHADLDPAFQHQVLILLASAVEAGDAAPDHLALLTDRCRLADGRPQVYGSQFAQAPDGLQPHPIEDPDGVDDRRRSMGLQPIAEYAALLEATWAET